MSVAAHESPKWRPPVSALPTDSHAEAREPRFDFASPPPIDPASARALTTLTAAGLAIEDAVTLITHGATAEEATDLLSLALLSPSVERYGPSLVALRILETARAAGGITGAQVRAAIDAHRRMVVVRPDGYLAPALGGEAIERRGDRVRLEDGRLYAGDLRVGETYVVRGGVLYAHSETYESAEVVSELGLRNDFASQLLDGAEAALRDVVVEIGRLVEGVVDDPAAQLERSVHAFGDLPRTVATLIRTSPELYAAYRTMSPDDRVRAVAKAATSLLLAFVGGGAAVTGARAAGHATGGARLLKFAGVAGGELVGLEAAAAAAALGHLGAGGLLAGTALMSAADDAANSAPASRSPREQWTVEYRVERGVGDVADRSLYEGAEDLAEALRIAEGMGATEHSIVRARVARRVAEDVRGANLDSLAELARLRPALGAEARVVDDALRVRLRAEVERVKALPWKSKYKEGEIVRLRRAIDDGGIDLHALLRQGGEPPVLTGAAAKAYREIERGEDVVWVKTRAEAEAIVAQFPELADTGGWGWDLIKGLLPDGKRNTLHWDDVFDSQGYLVHHRRGCGHEQVMHVQLLVRSGRRDREIRVEFGEPRGKNHHR